MRSSHESARDSALPLVVGFAAADGVRYGVRLLERLVDRDVRTHLVVSRDALRALGADAARVQALAAASYAPENQAARISSGSFLTRGMVVAPCDGASVAAIVMGLATNLVYRAADVTLKERRPLLLGVPPEALERVPGHLLERAAAVPGLALAPLVGSPDTAAESLLAQLGVEGAAAPA